MNRPEEAIQRAVAQALDFSGALWCHCPNGGKRGKIEAAIFKALGVRAGVPDLLIFSQPRHRPLRREWRGAAMELKATNGRISPAQQDWLKGLQNIGWLTAVCYSVDDALMQLREWGYIA